MNQASESKPASSGRFGRRQRDRLRSATVNAAEETPRSRLFEPGPALGKKAPILLHFLRSGFDPGRAASMSVEQVLAALPRERVATFNTDELLDYRANRPVATFSNWLLEEIDSPQIALDLVTDLSGRKVLVLHGPEPDLRWGEFIGAVVDLAMQSGVELGIDLLAVAATIPHTRPTVVHFNATSADLLPDQGEDPGVLSLPAPLDLVLREGLSNRGIPGLGLVVAVPYYLVDAEFPQASVTALARISEFTELELPVGDLEAASTQVLTYLNKQTEDSSEVAHVVSLLEKGFDEGSHRPSSLIATPSRAQSMPTAEEIGRKVEDFLRTWEEVPEDFRSQLKKSASEWSKRTIANEDEGAAEGKPDGASSASESDTPEPGATGMPPPENGRKWPRRPRPRRGDSSSPD